MVLRVVVEVPDVAVEVLAVVALVVIVVVVVVVEVVVVVLGPLNLRNDTAFATALVLVQGVVK